MNEMIAALKKAQKRTKAVTTQITRPEVIVFQPKTWETYLSKIAEAYPDLGLDLAAVENAGRAATGEPVKYAVLTRAKNPAEGIKAANVTLYSSGKAVFTNLAAVVL